MTITILIMPLEHSHNNPYNHFGYSFASEGGTRAKTENQNMSDHPLVPRVKVYYFHANIGTEWSFDVTGATGDAILYSNEDEIRI